MNNDKLSPFVKWVGGKRQLLDILNIFIPEEINNYFEPFLGGGALFLDLLPKTAILSDINSELITTWNVIKNNSNDLISLLKKHVDEHNLGAKEYFYKVRDVNPDELPNVEIAVKFIAFINSIKSIKTSFI